MKEQVIDQNLAITKELLEKEMRKAGKKIAPLWPLESFVAVNPYLGLVDQRFDSVAQTLAKVGGIQMTMPISFYIEKIEKGVITKNDLREALTKKSFKETSVEAFLEELETSEGAIDSEIATIATVLDVATVLSREDWGRFVTSRVSSWASSYFDNGQAMWKAADVNSGIFQAWKAEAEIDRTPEIMGLKGFRSFIKKLPNEPLLAAKEALSQLGLAEEELPIYFHRLLLRVGGWSAYVAKLDWDSNLYGGQDGKLVELLSILICWEAGVFQSLQNPDLEEEWMAAKTMLTDVRVQHKVAKQLNYKLILQEAFDQAAQRELISKFNNGASQKTNNRKRPKAQAIFCIDVRSEVYRRNLEMVDQEVETLGFAGFFGFPVNFVPLAHNQGQAQCPVLIPTGPTILEQIPEEKSNKKAISVRIRTQQLSRLWKVFKSGAITCFSFVSPIGLSYIFKLFTDSFGLTRPVANPDLKGFTKKNVKHRSVSLEVDTVNGQQVGIPLEKRVELAKNALRAMSLSENFAKFVLIVGHGSTSVNNPHASGLNCGACGGNTGEANAKVAAAVLNDNEVRAGLKQFNIQIPDDTVFLACLHDTTTDDLAIYNEFDVASIAMTEMKELKNILQKASYASRAERAVRMSVEGKVDKAVRNRSKDWSQVRPEWGLAGCSAFVVAPRDRTRNIDFEGRSFLHSYDWKKDEGFSILESIMTAPMVVTSWINLQYYASTVDNKHYGSGNKTLHNVTAGIGVIEGFSGDLRVGLPLQSVYDGEKLQHEPLRLNVVIEAPVEAINEIIKKHESVKNLCENGWINLLRLNEHGRVTHLYAGNLTWSNKIENVG